MLEAVIADAGARSIAAIARDLGVPVATAHRQVHSLIEEGFLTRHGRGLHVAGPRLLRLIGGIDEKQVMVNAAAPVLHRLADELGCVVQLGTLEDEMVTYRIKSGHNAGALFTRVGMQLEAYCSGIGKVLLAALPERQREAYLAGGPFPALTARTITDPDDLRDTLRSVAERGHAIDDGEIAEGLRCIAVPLRLPDERVLAAISASRPASGPLRDARVLDRLRAASAEIEAAVAAYLSVEAQDR